MARITYPDARKAVRQIERRDARGAEQYRAELKYHHFRPRVALSMTNAYMDEEFTLDTQQLQGAVTRLLDRMQKASDGHSFPKTFAYPEHDQA